MVNNLLKKRWILPLVISLGIFFDIFLLESPSQYLYTFLILLLLLFIHREGIGHMPLFNVSMVFFLLVLLRLILRFSSVLTEKFAVWFFVFAFAAVIKRALSIRSLANKPPLEL